MLSTIIRKNILSTAILACFSIVFIQTIYGQEREFNYHYMFHYQHQKWIPGDEFPSEEVFDIDQDTLGFIWLATDEGLLKFDGYQFQQYNISNTPEFQSDNFNHVEVSSLGVNWFASLEALYFSENGKFKLWKDSNGKTIENISSLTSDDSGRLWIGKKNQLYFLENNQIQLFDTKGYEVYRVFKGNGNKIWVVCSEGILIEIENDKIIEIHYFEQFATENISALLQDKDENLYLGVSFRGLFFYSNGILQLLNEDFKGVNTQAMILDDHGFLWAGQKGLIKYNPNGYEWFKKRDGLTDIGILKIFKDRFGNVWVGTKKGLNLFYKSELKNIHPFTKNKSPKTSIGTMTQDSKGEIFVGTYGEGMMFYRNGRLEAPENRMLAGEVINNLRPVNNYVSVSSNDGAFIISRKNDLIHIEETISNQIVFNYHYSYDSVLWINSRINITSPNLFRIENDEESQFPSQQFNRIYWFHESTNGELMMGSKEGLLLWKNNELSSLSNKLNIPFKRFTSHVYDSISDIHWMGTEGSGLVKYQHGEVQVFNSKNGFPTNIIRNLHFTEDDGMWILGRRKAYHFKTSTLTSEANHFSYYTINLNNTISPNSTPVSYQLENQNILMATREGMLELNTNYISPYKNKPYIKNVIIDSDTLENQNQFEIAANSQRISFEFSTINYDKNSDLIFEYRLLGFEEVWNKATKSRIANYSNLNAGAYQFQVRVKNLNGNNIYLKDEIRFSKPSKWYFSWLAFTIYILAILLFIRAIFLYRTRIIRGKNIELQKRVDSRTEELSKLNETLEQIVEERTLEITEINKELTANEERYSYALEASNDGIWDYDVLNNSIKYSPAIYTMLGYKPFEFEQSREAIYKLLHSDDQQKWHREYHDRLITGGDQNVFSDEYRMISKQNEVVWVRVKGKFVEWTEEGKPSRVVGTHTDITDEKLKNQEILDAILKTEDAERERIAKTIHDSLQQKLIISSLNFQSAKKELDKLSLNIKEKFETGWKYLQDSINESRAVSHALLPKEIIDYGVIRACEDLVIELDKVSESTTFNFQHNFSSDKLDNQQIEITLYRIIQEATTNIVKYAKASLVNVQLREFDDIYMLTIEDNGVGFDIDKKDYKSKGLGIRSMKNRLEAVNGFFEISSQPGKGTTILVEINKIF